MKYTAITLSFLLGFSFSVKAQSDTVNLRKHLGKTATLCNYVTSIKIVNDSLTYLNMGGANTLQKFIVTIRGNRIQLDWANLKGKHLCVTGVISLYKEQLELVALEPKQVVVN